MNCNFLLCIAALGICAAEVTAAQATVPQIATSSQGACTTFAKLHSDSPKADDITAPKLFYTVDPENLPGAPKHSPSGLTAVALLVDTSGNPQQVHVEKSLGPKYDKFVVAAVQQYRFKPALQHGKPVQVKICVGINFHIY